MYARLERFEDHVHFNKDLRKNGSYQKYEFQFKN